MLPTTVNYSTIDTSCILEHCFLYNGEYGPDIPIYCFPAQCLCLTSADSASRALCRVRGDTDLCHAAVIPVTLIHSSHALGWTWKEYHVLAIDDGIQLSIRKILPNGAHDGCSLHCPDDAGSSNQASCIINEMHKGTDLICIEYYYYYRCNK